MKKILGNKKFFAFLAVLLMVSMFLAFLPGTADAANSSVSKYTNPAGTLPYPPNALDLGHLEGSWYNIGLQYGKGSGPYVAAVWEGFHELFVPTWGVTHTKADIKIYEEQIKIFSPKFLDVVKGIADGAGPSLDKAKYADELSNYEKVLYINLETSMIRRHPPEFRHPGGTYDNAQPKSEAIAKFETAAAASDISGCCSLAMIGSSGATIDGSSIFAQNCDCPFYPHMYTVSYVATPDEEGANTYWTSGPAGVVVGLMSVNDKGLSVTHDTGPAGSGRNTEWFRENGYADYDFGVPWRARLFDTIVYDETTEQAVETSTIGTEQYRQATGRKTLHRDGGSATLISDGKSLAVLEVTANWYGIRRPGDYGEKGNYLANANHFLCKDSYDGENNYYPNVGMTRFGDEYTQGSSGVRYWTLFYLMKLNYGKINEEMVQEFMSSHFYIDRSGQRVDYIWDDKAGWISAVYGGTNCSHSGGYPEQYTGGTCTSKISVLKDQVMSVFYTLGRPCEWQGPWDSAEVSPDRVGKRPAK